MKRKLFYLIVTMSVTISVKAQQDYTAMFDSVFQYVSRNSATTGVLYERVLPFAGLSRFGVNVNSTDTINSDVFLQGYSEMYNAAFDLSKRLSINPDSLQSFIQTDISIIDIGLFHYKFNTLFAFL
jgi:hypothetical protein